MAACHQISFAFVLLCVAAQAEELIGYSVRGYLNVFMFDLGHYIHGVVTFSIAITSIRDPLILLGRACEELHTNASIVCMYVFSKVL